MFGLPFVTASLPHSPQFVRALQIRDESTRRVTGVMDNRVAPFLMYLFCGLALFIPTSAGPKLLEFIPKGVVYGILTFVGVAGVLPETGNQLSKRLLLLFSTPSEFPKDEIFTGVPTRTMHLYTFFQASALIICWVITLSSGFGSGQFWQYLGIFFPLWIVALIPIRKKVIPMFIREHELRSYLDTEVSPPAPPAPLLQSPLLLQSPPSPSSSN
jgi:solute carrier family 4 (anion exchanger) protein 1